ncbi:MAG: alkaline phosphatase D family protein [Planctomycetota bacterium]
MSAPPGYKPKVVATVYTAAFFLFAPPADAVPSAADIDKLARAASLTTETFIQQTFESRLRYEFNGEFLTPQDKGSLHKLAEAAGQRLQAIEKKQQQLKQQIEEYKRDDWDNRFGATGLWRKLRRNLYVTSLSKCEVDYYLALSAQPPRRNRILRTILDRTDSLDKSYATPYAQLIKARVAALFSRTEPAYRLPAKRQFDLLMERSDIPQPIALRAIVERIKSFGPTKPHELDALAQTIAKSDYSDDIELVLSLALVQRRYDPPALEKTVRKWPQIEDFLGSCVLSELARQIGQGQFDLEKISVFEADLAAQTAWKNTARAHKMQLDYLTSIDKFQTPLTFYVTAVAFADSSPAKAVNLLVKAGRLQQKNESNRLKMQASEIARQAAQLAYNLFIQDRRHCQLALNAFDNYCKAAPNSIDERLEYNYTIVLYECGRNENAAELLQKIADSPGGKYRNRARFDLITRAIEEKRHKKQTQRNKLLTRLNTLIADCTAANEYTLRTKALAIYCPLLLESRDKTSAQKVVDAVSEADADNDPNLRVFKSTALRQLGRLNESVRCLLLALYDDRCAHSAEAMALLSAVLGRIEELENSDPRLTPDYKKLAQICYDCLSGKQKHKAALFLIEISTFLPGELHDRESHFENLLDSAAKAGLSHDIDFLRCRARLLTAHRKFDHAARLWAQIAHTHRNEPAGPNRRSWKWWRAKYYHLYCLAKRPQTDKASLSHTIEVIENSFRNIPPLWAQKLDSLGSKTRLTDRRSQMMNLIFKIAQGVCLLSLCTVICTSCVAEFAPQDIHHAHGEMAGETTDSGIILQSRLTLGKNLIEGDMPGAPGVACFELSESPHFRSSFRTDWTKAVPEHDFIIKQKVNNLQSGTRYYYRLLYGPDKKNIKKGGTCTFKTHGGPAAETKVTFVVVTGMNYHPFHHGSRNRPAYTGADKNLGYPALKTILDMHPDFFVGTGDNVYYDNPSKTAAKTQRQLRKKWHEQFVQPRFIDLFAEVPTYWEKDDHDYRYNDCDNTSDRPPSPQLGKQTFLEQLPIVDPAEREPITYRTYQVNKLLQIWLVEGRDYRSANRTPDGPHKTIWGKEQEQWLKKTLLESKATFKILISATPMVGPDNNTKRDNHTNPKGFRHEGDDFFVWLSENGFLQKNFYLVCGDRHWQYHSIHPTGFEEFSCGALVDANARLGLKPGQPRSSDPEALINQIYTQQEPSGGFLAITVRPGRQGQEPTLSFAFYDENGALLYQQQKTANTDAHQ